TSGVVDARTKEDRQDTATVAGHTGMARRAPRTLRVATGIHRKAIGVSDLYVVSGEPFVLPHGAMVTRVSLEGTGRKQRAQLGILRDLSWRYGCVMQVPGGTDFLVYVRAEADTDVNRIINEELWKLRDKQAVLTDAMADRIVE